MRARYYEKISNGKSIFDRWFAYRIFLKTHKSIIKQTAHFKRENYWNRHFIKYIYLNRQ